MYSERKENADEHEFESKLVDSNKLFATGKFSKVDSIAYFDKILTNDCVNSVIAYDIEGNELSAMVASKDIFF